MSTAGDFKGSIQPGVGQLPRSAWERLFPDEAEGWAYYKACETAPPQGFTFAAVAVHRGEELVAAAPVFEMSYRLDTPLQASWKAASDWLARHAPGLVSLRVVGLGSPLADRLHLGLVPGLGDDERAAVLAVLLATLDAHAASRGAKILAIKDLADTDKPKAHDALLAAGFTCVSSLPVACLALPFETEDEYLASLSASTRKDIRRKLKTAGGVRLQYRTGIAGLEDQIFALYEETRANSGLDYGDFEQMSPAWFGEVARGLGDKALCLLCWVGDDLVGFNLLFVEPGRVIDKFIGFKYPQARELNLYLVTWMANVRWCLQHGITRLQSGQTAYTMKVRLGSGLDKSWVYFRHRGRFWNLIVKAVGPSMAFDKHDPELQKLAAKAVGRRAQ